MKNTHALLEDLSNIQGSCSIRDGIITFGSGETVDLKVASKQASQEKLALNSLLNGLRDLGFGTDNDINGGDAVAEISNLYRDVTERVLGGASASTESIGALAMRACDADPWGECVRYPRKDWHGEVNREETILSYWDWVGHRAESDGVEISPEALAIKPDMNLVSGLSDYLDGERYPPANTPERPK
jgi:hypothetical protein